MQKHVNEIWAFQKLLDIRGFTTYEKLLCLALTVSAGEKTECEPTVRTLARLCSCSPRQVIRTLTSLEAKGYITRVVQFSEAETNTRAADKYILRFVDE